MIKKNFVIFLILIFLIINVSAVEQVEISSSKVQNKVFPGSEVNFIIKIKNNQLREEIIKISPDPFAIYPFSDFVKNINIKPSQLTIGSGETGNFQVTVKYVDDIKSEQSYSTNVIIKSLVNDQINQKYTLNSYIMSSGEIVSIAPEIDDVISPGKEINFNVNFKNNVDENFNNLKLYISLGTYSQENSLVLKGKEETTKAFTLNLNSDIVPGDYKLILKLYNVQSLKGNREIRVKVDSNKILEEKVVRTNGFLSTKVIISKLNKGNVEFSKTIKYPVGSFEKLFTETTPGSNLITENGGNFYVWELNIKPSEEKVVVVETDYSGFFLTIFGLILLGGLIYYVRTRSLRITKNVIMVKEGHEKKLHYKVIICLQNYSGKQITNLKIIDLLPALIKHYSDFGTLEPKHMQQGGKGVRFIWEIPKLENLEERVISYKIEPQLNVFGNIRLPPASLQFLKNEKLIIRRSNIASFKLNK